MFSGLAGIAMRVSARITVAWRPTRFFCAPRNAGPATPRRLRAAARPPAPPTGAAPPAGSAAGAAGCAPPAGAAGGAPPAGAAGGAPPAGAAAAGAAAGPAAAGAPPSWRTRHIRGRTPPQEPVPRGMNPAKPDALASLGGSLGNSLAVLFLRFFHADRLLVHHRLAVVSDHRLGLVSILKALLLLRQLERVASRHRILSIEGTRSSVLLLNITS